MTWNPDYTAEFKRRTRLYYSLTSDRKKIAGFKQHYRSHPIDFIQDWHVTVDPRNAMLSAPVFMPVLLWQQQQDLVEAITAAIKADPKSKERNLAVVKSRGVGASWIGCHISDWLFSFYSQVVVGWGSNKAESVDNKNDPNCIFSKIRTLHEYKPDIFTPIGYDRRKHDKLMLIMNPENGSSIVGKAGDEIGRGGRSTVFFNDEKAFYEHSEKREAALSANTDHKIDISTHNGTGTVFYRTVKEDVCPVFFCHWRGDPRRSEQQMQAIKDEYESKGLLSLYLQEYEMDPTAGIENAVISSDWFDSAIDAHLAIGFEIEGETVSGLDVADEGGDKNAQAIRKGNFLFSVESWALGDTGQTALRAVEKCKVERVDRMLYDIIGVGSGIKSKINELDRSGKLTLKVDMFNGGGSLINPYDDFLEGIQNKDLFLNRKAQGWWELRTRFINTYRMRKGLEDYPPEKLISISSQLKSLDKLRDELLQPVYIRNESGLIKIDKQPNKAKSPNLADAVMICFAPSDNIIDPYST